MVFRQWRPQRGVDQEQIEDVTLKVHNVWMKSIIEELSHVQNHRTSLCTLH